MILHSGDHILMFYPSSGTKQRDDELHLEYVNLFARFQITIEASVGNPAINQMQIFVINRQRRLG